MARYRVGTAAVYYPQADGEGFYHRISSILLWRRLGSRTGVAVAEIPEIGIGEAAACIGKAKYFRSTAAGSIGTEIGNGFWKDFYRIVSIAGTTKVGGAQVDAVQGIRYQALLEGYRVGAVIIAGLAVAKIPVVVG